mmetsp:Transcript_6224/g.10134  ORF Transcript_6224/g.10134 Transcript_6224/m.10134 type:complete len:85 (-) Transcript_6224:2149-2403(-)
MSWMKSKNFKSREEALVKLSKVLLVKYDKPKKTYTFNTLLDNLKQRTAAEVAAAIKDKKFFASEQEGTGYDYIFHLRPQVRSHT